MFDFLQQLSHQHPPKQDIKPPGMLKQSEVSENAAKHSPKLKQQKSEKSLGSKPKATKQPKTLSPSASLQLGKLAELDPEALSMLQQIRDESEKRMKPILAQMVREEKAKVERKVYLREMSYNFDQYLEEVLVQSSSPCKYVRYGLAEMVDHVANSIYDDILLTDKYKISKKSNITKDQIKFIENSMSIIKSNQVNIRDKVGEMKVQLQREASKISDRAVEIIEKDSFSVQHPKTKEVQEFLKSLQMQRLQRRRKHEEAVQRQKQRRRQNQFYLEAAREKAMSERHQRLVQQFEEKKKIKEVESLEAERRNQEFREWMKIYKKRVPLFVEKQKKFVQNVVKQEEEQRFFKLMKRKQRYAPIQFDDIEDHQERYLEYKRDFKSNHMAQIKMRQEAEKKRQQQLESLHKGKFRYLVLQQMVAKKQEKDPKQELYQKKLRQLAYSQNVKQYHKPKADPVKQMELQSLLQSSARKRRSTGTRRISSISLLETGAYKRGNLSQDDEYVEKDPKIEGQRNRRYIKQYIREKIQKGQIKKPEEKPMTTIQPKPNYLQERRSGRQSRIRKAQTIDHEINSIKQKQDVGALVALVSRHDSKAQRLEQKFKYSAHKPEQQVELEDNYLFSIKAKLELLSSYD